MPTISSALGINRSIADSRKVLSELQQQLASGKKVNTYSDLGPQSAQILSLRSELSQIKGFTDTIALLDIRLDVGLLSLGRIRELASESKSGALAVGFELNATGQTIFQQEAGLRFDETIALLNTDVNGRRLFGGRVTEQDPVLPASEILDGAGGRAGFKQIAAERRQAAGSSAGRSVLRRNTGYGRQTLGYVKPAGKTG